jgi:hypothetical protein
VITPLRDVKVVQVDARKPGSFPLAWLCKRLLQVHHAILRKPRMATLGWVCDHACITCENDASRDGL